MSTVFTKIIQGELPGRFVWRDEKAVGFLSIAPLAQGHVLVVPVEEYDHWTDLPADLLAHLTEVSQHVASAVRSVWNPVRVGLMIQGFEVPHTHLHVWPTNSIAEFDFDRVDKDPDPAVMDASARSIREALRAAGHGESVPGED